MREGMHEMEKSKLQRLLRELGDKVDDCRLFVGNAGQLGACRIQRVFRGHLARRVTAVRRATRGRLTELARRTADVCARRKARLVGEFVKILKRLPSHGAPKFTIAGASTQRQNCCLRSPFRRRMFCGATGGSLTVRTGAGQFRSIPSVRGLTGMHTNASSGAAECARCRRRNSEASVSLGRRSHYKTKGERATSASTRNRQQKYHEETHVATQECVPTARRALIGLRLRDRLTRIEEEAKSCAADSPERQPPKTVESQKQQATSREVTPRFVAGRVVFSRKPTM